MVGCCGDWELEVESSMLFVRRKSNERRGPTSFQAAIVRFNGRKIEPFVIKYGDLVLA
jgi:hypothetical protein